MTAPGRTERRGLVLGGGGVLGFAWIVGALSALELEAGLVAGDVEVIVGTSAGSVAAAALGCGVSVDQLRRHHQGVAAADDPRIVYDYEGSGTRGLPPRPHARLGSPRLVFEGVRHPRRARAMLTIAGALPMGRGSLAPIGEMVRGLAADRSGLAADRSGLAADRRDEWPAHPRPWLVATDYDSGARVVFGRDATQVPLADAVVASCSIPAWYPPLAAGGRRYVDGGTVSNASVDLLLGADLDEVFVLAPMASVDLDRPRSPAARIERSIRRAITRGILADVDALRAEGVRVVLVTPGPDDLEVIGANLMNPRRRTLVLDTALRSASVQLRATLAMAAAGRTADSARSDGHGLAGESV